MGPNQDTMGDETITIDGVFDILRDRHRRIALGVLTTQERALTLRDLTNEIVAHEYVDEITDIPSKDVNQISLSLSHIHIPKLADEKIIEYDQDRDLIVPTDRLEQLEPHLSMALEGDPVGRTS